MRVHREVAPLIILKLNDINIISSYLRNIIIYFVLQKIIFIQDVYGVPYSLPDRVMSVIPANRARIRGEFVHIYLYIYVVYQK